jgi:hypothetical protein
MKRIAVAIVALFAVLLLGTANTAYAGDTTPSRAECKKNPKLAQCPKTKKSAMKQSAVPPKVPPVVAPSLSPTTSPMLQKSGLSSKQDAMRDAFMECVAKVSEGNPTQAVVDFVFSAQATREGPGLKALWQSLRGSPVHHGHEVCLARVFGLRGFRNVGEVLSEAGNLLVEIPSPYVEVVEKEIPPDRRFTRPWVRDYVTTLAEDMHEHFASLGSTSSPPLRVTSMIRSFDDQAKEVRAGRSPADCRFPFLCSTHTTSSSLDLGFRDMGGKERAWLDARLAADQKARKIFFIIERSHYHVFVLPPEYMGEEQ